MCVCMSWPLFFFPVHSPLAEAHVAFGHLVFVLLSSPSEPETSTNHELHQEVLDLSWVGIFLVFGIRFGV